MPEMTMQRVPFTVQADNQLRALKARTGITPNLLCRMGFCLSLEEPGVPQVQEEASLTGRVINRPTLLGEYDTAFVALLFTWMSANGMTDLNEGEANTCFLAHIHRGVELLISRLKSLADLDRLTAQAPLKG